MRDEIDECDLHAYLDGELDPAREALVRAHLEANPADRERLRAYAEQKLLLALAGPGAAAPGVGATALAGRLLARRRVALLGRVAAAALLVAVGWGGHAVADRLLGRDLPEYAQAALETHDALAEMPDPPMEVAAARGPELARFLAARLGEPVEVPELRAIGFRLVGARLVGTEEGPAAQLVYQDEVGRRLSLALVPEGEATPEELEVSEAEGYVVGVWRGRGFAYALVGRTTHARLEQVASALGAPVEPAGE